MRNEIEKKAIEFSRTRGTQQFSLDDIIEFGLMIEKELNLSQEKAKADKEVIEEVYKAYPSKCVVRGCSTGKTAKNKEKIRRLLKDNTKDELISIIKRYVSECEKDDIYMKNFSTFLNNLPDYEEEVDILRLCYWTYDGRQQKSAYKDYFDTLESQGSEIVKFISYVD